ncbi:MAG: hypothetical protein EOP84_11175 [Verrucomicrobiaceae bacterium]|nr:MAG: hypothetical protein EOP84_11175 [Verrucomicrobiaceae bacterium]
MKRLHELELISVKLSGHRDLEVFVSVEDTIKRCPDLPDIMTVVQARRILSVSREELRELTSLDLIESAPASPILAAFKFEIYSRKSVEQLNNRLQTLPSGEGGVSIQSAGGRNSASATVRAAAIAAILDSPGNVFRIGDGPWPTNVVAIDALAEKRQIRGTFNGDGEVTSAQVCAHLKIYQQPLPELHQSGFLRRVRPNIYRISDLTKFQRDHILGREVRENHGISTLPLSKPLLPVLDWLS